MRRLGDRVRVRVRVRAYYAKAECMYLFTTW